MVGSEFWVFGVRWVWLVVGMDGIGGVRLTRNLQLHADAADEDVTGERWVPN